MWPYHAIALDMYEERLRDAERRWRILANAGCAGSAAPRRARAP